MSEVAEAPDAKRQKMTNGNGAANGLSEAAARLVADRQVLSTQSLPTSRTPTVFKTVQLPDHQRQKILVTGGAGFVGSHLVDRLMCEGHEGKTTRSV